MVRVEDVRRKYARILIIYYFIVMLVSHQQHIQMICRLPLASGTALRRRTMKLAVFLWDDYTELSGTSMPSTDELIRFTTYAHYE